MLIWVSVVSVIAILLTFRNWRWGLVSVLVIGVLQDVFRKLTPGVPAYYLLWSTVIYAIVVASALRTNGIAGISFLYLRDRALQLAVVAFLLLVGLQLLNSLVRYGSPAIVILGALFYLGPLVAMLVGAGFIDSERRIRAFLKAYLAIIAPACLTVYLSAIMAEQIPVLRDVGTFIGRELVIYDVGTILQSNPGLMRVGEIAAWHAATCVVFLTIFSIQTRSQLLQVFQVLLILLLLGAIVLTGRRKMLAALAIFFALQWGMLLWFRLGMRKISILLLITAAVSIGVMYLYQPSASTANYIKRGESVFSSIDDRFETTLDLMRSAVWRSEGIGLGAGATSQGARHSGAAYARQAGGAAESGFGKLIVELGPFGFLLLISVIGIAASKVLSQLPAVRHLGSNMLLYEVSFLAFLIANMFTFAVASQLFGDMFVLIVTGTIAGFIVRIHNAAVDERSLVPSVRAIRLKSRLSR